jgi:hypothetical protein
MEFTLSEAMRCEWRRGLVVETEGVGAVLTRLFAVQMSTRRRFSRCGAPVEMYTYETHVQENTIATISVKHEKPSTSTYKIQTTDISYTAKVQTMATTSATARQRVRTSSNKQRAHPQREEEANNLLGLRWSRG